MDKRLYTLGIPEDAQMRDEQSGDSNVARQGVITSGQPVAEGISSNPDDVQLEGEFRGEYAEEMAHELEDLVNNSNIDHAPFYRVDNDGNWLRSKEEGYYALKSASVSPSDPRGGSVNHYSWTVNVVRKGAPKEFWRGVAINEREIDHTFGNDLYGHVGVPAAAEKVIWWDKVTGARSIPTPVTTRSTAYGDVEIFDIDEVDYESQHLLYWLDLHRDGRTDTAVWDDRGYDSKTDGNGIPQWFEVFDTSTQPEGAYVLTNGYLRVRLDDTAGTLTAEEWDDANSTWADVGLTQPAGTSLFDADLIEISMMQARAQLTFDDNGTLFTLNAILDRGRDAVLFHIPDGENGPIPTNIEDWIRPIASTTLVDPQPMKLVVPREEVRR